MKNKVLITCPPMLKQISVFYEKFKSCNMEITTPNVVQTLSEDQLIKLLPDHDGWIIGDDPASKKVLEAGKRGRLKAAVKWGIGVDNVDMTACKDLDIPILNTPNMFGNEVADLGMCYISGLARDSFLIDREIRKGNWIKPTGITLQDKVLGIVGLGDIGRNIATRAHAHGMKIIGWDPNVEDIKENVSIQKNWPEKVETCDFLILACALNKYNHHIINKDIINKFKKGLRIINISRGGLIDEESLIYGLNNNTIYSAALDVFEEEPLDNSHKLLNYPRCILGSHNASNTIDGVIKASDKAIDILDKMFKENNFA
jgi:D-3-phosphoglycerate dehydrogenase